MRFLMPRHLPRVARPVALVALLSFLSLVALAQGGYRKPPREVSDVLNAPVTPTAFVSPSRETMLLATGVRYPAIADLAQPMLRLAGLRINPNTVGPHRTQYFVAYTLKRVSDGAETKVMLPPGAHAGAPIWSPGGKRFAFTNTTPTGIELWTGDAATGRVAKLRGVMVNAVYGDPVQWLPDAQTLLAQTVPTARPKLAPAPGVPTGPNVQESSGKAAPVRTYEDLLKTPYDEDQFEYYATTQLAYVDTTTGKMTNVAQPAIYDTVRPSPDGQFMLAARAHRPFSYLHPVDDFPKEVEVWDKQGRVVHKLASLPLQDEVPIDGVQVGPRRYGWRPTEPATLVWVEALDEGNPKKKVPHRDRVMMLNVARVANKAASDAAPMEVFKTEQRLQGLQWFERGGLALVSDYNRDTRKSRTWIVNADNPSEAPRLVWERNVQDRYNDPGTPLTRVLGNGQRAIWQNDDYIFLVGQGASRSGDRPFLDRFDIKSRETVRMFQSDEKSYETPVTLISDTGFQFITRRETPIEPSNYFIRTVGIGRADNFSGPSPKGWDFFTPLTVKPLTNFPDPSPQLRGIKKQLVTYKRKDGVQCSFTLYLPPDYKEGTRLPTVVWAYPLEFNDADTAGQISGSTQRFTTIGGYSHLFFLLEGYAILDNVTMPVVGDPEKMNDTYVDQIVMSARAAIDKAVEMGVTDRDRVGVGGHSYGAFMTANLLAHSDLFRAGIARSGAYNRTLTPFGFQSERRTLWEAADMYIKVSPFMNAQRIKEPILLIHGEADDNTGTFPIQSERMYQAIRGNGGTVRLVMLPLEAHGYTARETTEHVLYEMINWFDKYVKHAPPRDSRDTAGGAAAKEEK